MSFCLCLHMQSLVHWNTFEVGQDRQSKQKHTKRVLISRPPTPSFFWNNENCWETYGRVNCFIYYIFALFKALRNLYNEAVKKSFWKAWLNLRHLIKLNLLTAAVILPWLVENGSLPWLGSKSIKLSIFNRGLRLLRRPDLRCIILCASLAWLRKAIQSY